MHVQYEGATGKTVTGESIEETLFNALFIQFDIDLIGFKKLPGVSNIYFFFDKREIYYLPANKAQELSKSTHKDGRFSVPVESLIKVADPYAEGSKILAQKEQPKKKEAVKQQANDSKDLIDDLLCMETSELLGTLSLVLSKRLK